MNVRAKRGTFLRRFSIARTQTSARQRISMPTLTLTSSSNAARAAPPNTRTLSATGPRESNAVIPQKRASTPITSAIGASASRNAPSTGNGSGEDLPQRPHQREAEGHVHYGSIGERRDRLAVEVLDGKIEIAERSVGVDHIGAPGEIHVAARWSALPEGSTPGKGNRARVPARYRDESAEKRRAAQRLDKPEEEIGTSA